MRRRSSSPAEEARRVVGGGVLDRGGAAAPASAPSPRPRPRRARSARPAGRPSRRSAPRRGSRGSAGSRRRRGSRSASPRGSRGPWRPSGCRPGRRSPPRRIRPGSARGRRAGRWCRSRGGRPASARAARAAAPRSARSRRPPAPASSRRRPGRRAAPASEWAQWWQTRRPDSRWTISETSQLGQPQWCPQERQVSQGAKPRRLTITIALRPAARTSSSAVQVSACSGPERGSTSRMSTMLTGGMRRPSTRRGSSRRGSSSQVSGRGVAVPATRTAPRSRGPVAGDGAGVVGRVALLLVGGVVLLVDDDQAEVADRGEDRRARADADLRLAAAQPLPLVEALAVGEGAVEDGEAVAEAGAEAGDGLRGEADLGDEDDRAAPAGERRLDRRQVDLGLARAGDAVEELLAGRAGLAVERRDEGVDGGPLLGEEPGRLDRGVEPGGGGGAAHARIAGRDQAALGEAPQRSRRSRRPRRPAAAPRSRRPRPAPPAPPAASPRAARRPPAPPRPPA